MSAEKYTRQLHRMVKIGTWAHKVNYFFKYTRQNISGYRCDISFSRERS
jgi:hypothetical protein